jgi:hypothetical protein
MNYPNMSYCMFENTTRAMEQILEALVEADYKEGLELNQYEKPAYGRLKGLCEEIIYEMERLEDAGEPPYEDEEED